MFQQKYLSYKDGKYYFWVEVYSGSPDFYPNNSSTSYIIKKMAVDVKNKKVATINQRRIYYENI